MSFVLTVDVNRTKLHLWAGRSGTLKRRAANDLIRCVEHAIAPPIGTRRLTRYAKCEINVIASYPGNGVPAAARSAAPDPARRPAGRFRKRLRALCETPLDEES